MNSSSRLCVSRWSSYNTHPCSLAALNTAGRRSIPRSAVTVATVRPSEDFGETATSRTPDIAFRLVTTSIPSISTETCDAPLA